VNKNTKKSFLLSLRERMFGTPDRRGKRPKEKNKNKIIQTSFRKK